MTTLPLKLNGVAVGLHKAVIGPAFGARSVLTRNPWAYVELWLKRKNDRDSLFYWNQAQQFFRASTDLPLHSAPLTLYYAFMNAAKALLESRSVSFAEQHGVSRRSPPRPARKASISNEGLRIQPAGVLPSLASYYSETESTRDYTLKDLFFNMCFVHRTYCLTYRSQTEMFVPLAKNCFLFDDSNQSVRLEARIVSDIDIRNGTLLDFTGSRP